MSGSGGIDPSMLHQPTIAVAPSTQQQLPQFQPIMQHQQQQQQQQQQVPSQAQHAGAPQHHPQQQPAGSGAVEQLKSHHPYLNFLQNQLAAWQANEGRSSSDRGAVAEALARCIAPKIISRS
jgi:hypothetical protein